MIQKPILLSSFLFLYIRALLHSIHPYIRTSVHLYTKKNHLIQFFRSAV
ncbi:hypothetical protein R008_L12986 [Saccharomyces cerevisiae R008]|nr:hypothetical protein R008_L12986 [Saccharomyces cerevisiae R008]